MDSVTLADCPRRAPGVHLVRDEGVAFLADLDNQRMFALNDTAAALWELCDGETSVQEMAAAAASLFDASTSAITADVADTVRRLRSVGALEA